MALLVDEETKKELKDRIDEFLKFGMVLNYMYDIDKISEDDLEKMFFSTDLEMSTIIYFKIIKKIDETYENIAYKIYSEEVEKNDDLDKDNELTYLNKYCLKKIISKLNNIKNLDKTYVNTYNYLLSNTGK